MGELRHINKSELGLVNGAIGIVQPKPELDLDEEVLDI